MRSKTLSNLHNLPLNYTKELLEHLKVLLQTNKTIFDIYIITKSFNYESISNR